MSCIYFIAVNGGNKFMLTAFFVILQIKFLSIKHYINFLNCWTIAQKSNFFFKFYKFILFDIIEMVLIFCARTFKYICFC